MRQDWGSDIDRTLLERVARLSRGSQRWLKTAVQVIRTMPAPNEEEAVEAPPYVPPAPKRHLAPPPPAAARPDLEDVIMGRARLDDQLEAYPDLADELEGLGDIIDMLRRAGEQRRKKGEDILREEILGQPPEERDEEE